MATALTVGLFAHAHERLIDWFGLTGRSILEGGRDSPIALSKRLSMMCIMLDSCQRYRAPRHECATQPKKSPKSADRYSIKLRGYSGSMDLTV